VSCVFRKKIIGNGGIKMKHLFFVLVLLFAAPTFSATPNNIEAPPGIKIFHSGGTDKCGCHYNRKTGKYHCHKRKKRGGDCPD